MSESAIVNGMVNLIINCKGELVRCEIDNKTNTDAVSVIVQ